MTFQLIVAVQNPDVQTETQNSDTDHVKFKWRVPAQVLEQRSGTGC